MKRTGVDGVAIISLAMLLAAAQPTPAIKVTPVPGRGFSVQVAAFDSGQYNAVLEQIQALAKQRCGKRSVRFGRFGFENWVDAERKVTVIEKYQQAFSCFDPATDPYKPVPADWEASAAETAAISSFITRYLGHFETGNAAAAAAMMDPMMEVTTAEMQRTIDEAKLFHEEDGTLAPRFIQWMRNPEGATYPGAYAYFVVDDADPGVAGTCGGILVQRVQANEYRVAQYDVRFISQALVDEHNLTLAQLNQLCAR